jgi:hypothetical protein
MSSLTRFFTPSKIKKYLIDFVSEDAFNVLNDALITENAYLAGGSVLSCYSNNFETYDLDIYINQKNFNNFVIKLNNIDSFGIDDDVIMAPPYDGSFFKKNNILFRITCYFRIETKIRHLDIMVVSDEINIPETVLRNFDLTICEIWYNGRTIDGSDLEGIKNKVGRLRKEYNDSLFKHLNSFIIKRIRKYRKRGFEIIYEIPEERQFYILENKKKLTNSKEWVIKKFITFFYSYKNRDVFYRYLLKSSNNKSLLYPYDSLIKTKNKFLKYFIFINSIKNFDNYEDFCELLKKFFLIKKPKILFNKILKHFYDILKNYVENDIYSGYIEEVTGLYDYEITDLSTVKYLSTNDHIENIMKKYIKNYNDNITVENSSKDEYDKLIEKNNNKCWDIILIDDIELDSEYFKEDEALVFILNGKFFCYTKSYLEEITENYLDNWFCECTGVLDETTQNKPTNTYDLENIYIKIPLDINVFVLYKYILFILKNNYSVYFLNFNKRISHSLSYKNTNYRTANYVGANHCQDGSVINIYNILYYNIL